MKSRLRLALIAVEGAALLVGTIFGAGFLILPHSALRAGLGANIFWLLFFTLVVTLLHLMYGEIVLATQASHRLPGYAKIYLGRWGEGVAIVTFIVGVFGGLLVYLLLGGHFLQKLFFESIGWSQQWTTALFWFILTFLVLSSLKLSSRVNFVITTLTMATLFGISIFALRSFSPANLSLSPTANFFFPYGIILFSLVGYLAIPDIRSLLDQEKVPSRLLAPITVAASLFAGIFSALFMVAILGATGVKTTQDGISGLSGIFPANLLFLGLSLAFLEIANSYLIFGISIRQTLQKDFGLSPIIAASLIMFLPIIFFLSGITDFVKVVSVLGSIWISLDSILILLIWQKAKAIRASTASILKLPRWLIAGMVLIFVVGGLTSLFLGD